MKSSAAALAVAVALVTSGVMTSLAAGPAHAHTQSADKSVVFDVLKRPGRVRIVNTYGQTTFRCVWRGQGHRAADGRAVVPPSSSVVAVVQHHAEVFTCHGGHVGYGELIKGIRLPDRG